MLGDWRERLSFVRLKAALGSSGKPVDARFTLLDRDLEIRFACW